MTSNDDHFRGKYIKHDLFLVVSFQFYLNWFPICQINHFTNGSDLGPRIESDVKSHTIYIYDFRHVKAENWIWIWMNVNAAVCLLDYLVHLFSSVHLFHGHGILLACLSRSTFFCSLPRFLLVQTLPRHTNTSRSCRASLLLAVRTCWPGVSFFSHVHANPSCLACTSNTEPACCSDLHHPTSLTSTFPK